MRAEWQHLLATQRSNVRACLPVLNLLPAWVRTGASRKMFASMPSIGTISLRCLVLTSMGLLAVETARQSENNPLISNAVVKPARQCNPLFS